MFCARPRKGINEGARVEKQRHKAKNVRASTCSISSLESLGEKRVTLWQSVSFSMSSYPRSSLFTCYERIGAGVSTPSGAFMRERREAESRREINRLSFCRL